VPRVSIRAPSSLYRELHTYVALGRRPIHDSPSTLGSLCRGVKGTKGGSHRLILAATLLRTGLSRVRHYCRSDVDNRCEHISGIFHMTRYRTSHGSHPAACVHNAQPSTEEVG